MKLVLMLPACDEAAAVADAHLPFHLNAGTDALVATTIVITIRSYRR